MHRRDRYQKVLAVSLALVLLFTACHHETEQDRVKKVVLSVQKDAEAKQIRSVLDRIARNYRDPQGNDYDGIKGLLAYYFFRHQAISVYIPDIAVTVSEGTAQATFQAILTGRDAGSGGTVIPEALGMYTFTVALVKVKSEWLVSSAKWERAAEQGP